MIARRGVRVRAIRGSGGVNANTGDLATWQATENHHHPQQHANNKPIINKHNANTTPNQYTPPNTKPNAQAFLDGFWELVPRDLLSVFNDHELELLISGLPDIDVADLRANTEYQGYSPGSPVIRWFWDVVEAMDKEDRALLLQFVTGAPRAALVHVMVLCLPPALLFCDCFAARGCCMACVAPPSHCLPSC